MLNQVNEADWQRILDPETADNAKRAAEKKYDRLSSDEVQYLRSRAKTDLFFLSRGVLGYDRLSDDLHLHLCDWLGSTQTDRFRILLLPRGHFKTTIVTIADSIQIALPAVTGGLPHPRDLGPDVRVMLGHETHDGASRFLFEITGHFTGNPALVGLFPECVPHPRKQRMNQSMLDLPRESNWAEPTFDTMGVGAKSQGRHYNFIKLDDIFGEKARDSEAERKTVLQWFNNIQAFFAKFSTSHMDIPGTRYSLDDVYGHAMSKYGERLRRYIRRVEEVQNDGSVRPIFHEEFSSEDLSIIRSDRKVWIQYSNDPRSDFAEFSPEWKRFFHWTGPRKVAIFTGASSEVYDVSDLDVTILCDPSVSQAPGVLVTGVSPKLQVFVLETFKKPVRPPEFVELIFKLVQKWWPRLVSIEEVIFSEVYKHWIEREMTIRNVRFNIYPYKPPKGKRKEERVRGLSNYFSAGQIYFQENQIELLTEYDTFGATEDYHLLDAMAQGPEVWRPGLSRETWERYKKMEEEMFEDRDNLTGYSAL